MQYRKLNELKKLPNNPRIIRDKQFKTLCDSIRDNPKYFEARPVILSNRTGEMVIIAGNQRYEAAKSLKLKEVPTFLIEGLDEAKEREIIIRDNISNGEFDFDELANSWSDLPLVEWGVDLPEDWLKEGGEIEQLSQKGNLAERFGVPPFSVLNAREGWWQDRKAAWIGLGIKSELGRGGGMEPHHTRQQSPKTQTEPLTILGQPDRPSGLTDNGNRGGQAPAGAHARPVITAKGSGATEGGGLSKNV